MKLEFALLAEAAVQKGGQLSVLSTFDVLGAPAFPLQVPQCALVVKLVAHTTELGKHAVAIRLLDADGHPVTTADGKPQQIEGELVIGPSPVEWVESNAQIVLNMHGLHLPGPGTYTFVVSVDGRHMGETRLFVRSTAQTQQAA